MFVCRDHGSLILAVPLVTALVFLMSGAVAIAATGNMTSSIPHVKLVYANHTYEMLPFVVLNDEGVKKLNFPRLADTYNRSSDAI